MFDASAAAPACLELRALSYTAGDQDLIGIPALRLGDTGTTVIMGSNGAGKSVLLRLMHGLLQPTSGQVLCFGRPLSPEAAREQALVFQTPVPLRRSAEANIAFVLKTRGKPIGGTLKLLEMVGLADKARTPARRLSGGERQRLAIAQALATEPRLLFLDEPTASLDPASVFAIEEIVRLAAKRGVRVVFVTHDAGQARRLADDVVFLSRGRVAEHAPAKAFFDSPSTAAARAYLDGRLDTSEV